jgi:catechol 2,3-dioxygenase-like lactoylglutathione lyase family enzyme
MGAQLDFIGLVVEDMGRSLAFYRRLGVEIPEGADREPHVGVKLPGGMTLAWDTWATIRSFDADWQPPTGGSRMSLAFRCDTPEQVDTLHAELVAAGYRSHLEPWDAFWGQRYAAVYDPDGNSTDLYCPKE